MEKTEYEEKEIGKLQNSIIQKTKEVDSCKEKINLYDRAFK